MRKNQKAVKDQSQDKLNVFIPSHLLKTAVLFLIFNRLDTTKKVFEEIRKAKPPRLYIAADGAREKRQGENERVKTVREYVMANIDWDCEIKTFFREKNLGCKYAVSGAIDWFFENEEMGIILEDDCLPSQSFFWFCEELLDKYKDDMRIMLISGYNKQNVWNSKQCDYFFSHLGGIWGWASWRRAWRSYDIDMSLLTEFSKGKYFNYLLGNKLGTIRQKQMEDVLSKNINSWAYQWGFARHINSGLTCVPSKSLVQNIGVGSDATHTCKIFDKVQRHETAFPIKDNTIIVADRKYDGLFFNKEKKIRDFINKLKIIKKTVFRYISRLSCFKVPKIIKEVKIDSFTYLSKTNLNDLYKEVIKLENKNIKGIIIEAGCALGGSAIVIATAKSNSRPLYVYDTFSMIPSPSNQDGIDVQKRYNIIRSGHSSGIDGNRYYGYEENLFAKVMSNFQKHNVAVDNINNNIHLVRGLFKDTLYPNNDVALAHIDCDWYESVMICLERIAPHLISGGVLVIDDYDAYSGCKKAVDEYFSNKNQYEFIRRSKLHIIRR